MRQYIKDVVKCGTSCPMYQHDDGCGHCGATAYCKHPEAPLRNPVYSHREILRWMAEEYTKTVDFPDWCPLIELSKT